MVKDNVAFHGAIHLACRRTHKALGSVIDEAK